MSIAIAESLMEDIFGFQKVKYRFPYKSTWLEFPCEGMTQDEIYEKVDQLKQMYDNGVI
jgi:hypothetical protein